ncbi:hypothetical protein OGAPHI_007349 [Ogataea philodendri]|uniref:Uncharacterized protein n=1 Tax=Ogataea philodendri TaxID=1378263 RepID=A0A9P8NVE8_9ASCO|nr:uncharacterized protein OGAPHI_007349 [Ogataea philodendri]KAH3660144.1 hypothetical protein OGAPHI_007349 [Ogataea philodendri]
MLQGQSVDLAKRYWSYSNDGSRYAFFAFLAAVIVIFFVFTCLLNVRRIRRGRTPIISQYLAPPSYYQSERNRHENNGVQLPTYTAQPNPNQDIGYYDSNGNFIPYSKTDGTATSTNPFDNQGTGTASTQGNSNAAGNTTGNAEPLSQPEQAHARPENSPQAYPSANPQPSSTSSTGNYAPPPGPPPTHAKEY